MCYHISDNQFIFNFTKPKTKLMKKLITVLLALFIVLPSFCQSKNTGRKKATTDDEAVNNYIRTSQSLQKISQDMQIKGTISTETETIEVPDSLSSYLVEMYHHNNEGEWQFRSSQTTVKVSCVTGQIELVFSINGNIEILYLSVEGDKCYFAKDLREKKNMALLQVAISVVNPPRKTFWADQNAAK